MKPRFSLALKDERFLNLVSKTDHRILASWAFDCAKRVLRHFEKSYPEDKRPGKALDTLRSWIKTGVFRMTEIRGASLAAHAAAREAGEDTAARSAARAAGQAVATAHVRTHSLGAAIYALQAIHRAAGDFGAEAAVARERSWQYRHLRELRARQYPGRRDSMNTREKTFSTIDAYIAASPEDVRPKLERLRRTIRSAAPGAEESISYGMPAFKLDGPLVYFAAFKSHIGFFPTSSPIPAFKKELASYKTSKGAVQFPLDRPIPFGLVAKIVKYRVKEILQKGKKRK